MYKNFINNKNELNKLFDEFFKCKGYIREKEVEISSGVDSSVTYIGSGISVLKPILLNNSINENTGNYVIQKSIRTQALKNIYLPTISAYNSFFEAYCVLVNFNNLENLIRDTIEFLRNILKIYFEDIAIKVNSMDSEFIKIIDFLDEKINVLVDTEPLTYYRHKYGLEKENIFGRNFNIAIKINDEFKDIGNIIIIESNDKKYGVELALGAEVILMIMNDLQTTLHASNIARFLELNDYKKIKYADCLIVVSNLEKESIQKNKHRYPVYLYKKYLRALKYWEKELGFTSEYTAKLSYEYLKEEYKEEKV